MRKIDMIVVHCSGSRCNHPYTVEQLRHDHVEVNGWFDIGYHYYITRDGKVHECRPVERMGAHARGANANSIGICYEGGLDKNGKAKDTRTDAQKKSMRELVQDICHRHDIIDILGHRDTSPDKNGNGIVEKCEWMKECPCFDVKSEFTSFLPPVIVRP